MSEKFLKVGLNGEYEEVLGFLTSEFINTSAGVADAGKPIVLDAAGKIASNMIDFGAIDHGSLSGLGDDDHTQYLLTDGTRNPTGILEYSGAFSFTTDNQIVSKKYVDDLHTGDEWHPDSALDYIVDNTLAPPTEVSGDVYVLSHDGGAPNAAYDGASAGDIVKFDGSVWVATTPTTGTKISVDTETDGVRLWSGSSWDRKFYESTTASTGLTKVGVDIQIASSAAGDGLGFAAGVLSVNVDDSSIEIATDTLQVKALGITNDMLAGSIADGKLAQDYIQTSEVDGTTIEFSGGNLNVVANGINDTHIDFGTGLNQVSAADLPIADSGNFTDETDVEGALQELYSELTSIGVEYNSDGVGVSKGDLVFVSAADTISTYGTITAFQKAIGLASATVGAAAAVKVLANDTVVTGVLTGATAGDVYYWDGSSHVNTIPSTSGAYVIQTGVAKNATDLHTEVRLIKKNI